MTLSRVLIFCCLLSAQSFLVPSFAGLMTIFYCLTTLGVMQLSLLSLSVWWIAAAHCQHSHPWFWVLLDSQPCFAVFCHDDGTPYILSAWTT
jgi:hypothetical protein